MAAEHQIGYSSHFVQLWVVKKFLWKRRDYLKDKKIKAGRVGAWIIIVYALLSIRPSQFA